MLIRPSMCPNEDRRSGHGWGIIFLSEIFSIIRVYGCPHAPHVFPKNILEKIGIVKFFWQLIMMNQEYLGPKIKKGSFVCKNVKVGDFFIGKDATEELDEFMREFLFPSAPTRTYDPNDLGRHALK